MKPGLRHFFDSMAEYFADPSGLARLRAAHPGWDATPSRVALYGDFVHAHVREVMEKLYPLVMARVGPERWEPLVKGYTATRPARHFEMNQAGEAFPAYVADVTAAQGLPEFLPALARFEWADWAVYASEERVPERVERLTANPTLMVLQHPYKLCAYVRGKGGGLGSGGGRGAGAPVAAPAPAEHVVHGGPRARAAGAEDGGGGALGGGRGGGHGRGASRTCGGPWTSASRTGCILAP